MRFKTSGLTESAEIHDKLNPKIWTAEGKLRSEVADKLDEITDYVLIELKNKEIPYSLADVRIVGSNAGYNYNKHSDIDLHLVMDTGETEGDPDLLNLLYLYFKSSFNETYDISIHGINVELYIEETDRCVDSDGIYSLMQEEWIKFPKKTNVKIPDTKKLFKRYEDIYIDVCGNGDKDDAQDLLDDIYELRKDSIKKGGDLSVGNLVFKEFRERGYLQDLRDLINDERSKDWSLEALIDQAQVSGEEPLVEDELDEDYEADRKKYTELVGEDKRLTPEEFDLCCKADPTYKEGSNKSGSYLTWIVKRYTDFRKNNPTKEFDFTTCADDLRAFNELLFHKRFKDEKDKRKNIDYFKTVQELDDFLHNEDNYNKEESGRQQQKKKNKTTIKVDHVDPDLVFENDRCKVWVPYSYETSRQLGGDTSWCTAASTRGNWDSYSKEGPLFIMIMKDDPKEKYQFHFESNQYMDRDDNPVAISRFPEMQMSWVDEVRKDYYVTHDKIIVNQLATLLNPDGTAPEDCIEQVGGLIKGLHDNTLATQYSARINKEYLELFYENLTPTLTQDSKAIEYLEQCIGKVDIVLPRSVKSLGDKCFWSCDSLRSITIPDSITSLGGYCFGWCPSLDEITLPDTITLLPDHCFEYCSSLKEINLPDSITSLGSGCFEFCRSLQNLTLHNSIASLGTYCFYYCIRLQEITLPDGITSLGQWCFGHCMSLRKINLPSSITNIEYSCFPNCPLKDVYYGGSEEDRKRLRVECGNEPLLKARWHYNYKG